MIPRVPVAPSSSASNSRYTFALAISRILLNDDRFLLPLYPSDGRLAWVGKCVRSAALEITPWPMRRSIWKCHLEGTIHQAVAKKKFNDRTEIDRDPRCRSLPCESFFDYYD